MSGRRRGRSRRFAAFAVTLGFVACGTRTGLFVDEARDAGPETGDGRVGDEGRDAREEDASGPLVDSTAPCDAGTVVGDVFGHVRYFAGGSALPAGRYLVTYVDGCMKYSPGQGWSVHAYGPGSPTGNDAWWLVGDTSATRIVMPPGTVGYVVGAGGYESFDACVAANRMLPPVTFDFAGGRVGLWVDDSPYDDNIAGSGGRSPTWELVCAM